MNSAASSPGESSLAPSAPRFVHLRLHSEYSITDGIVQLDQAIAVAAADGMPALGMSDLANLFGMVKFYKGARGKGIKPIIGVDAWIQNEAERDKPQRVLLICKSRAGYGQLCELLTRAYLENKHRGRAEMRRAWFEGGAASELLCLSGAMSGDIGAAKKPIIAGEEGICKACGVATLSIDYYELGRTTGEMAVKILKGEADISTMAIEYYPNPVKKYNPDMASLYNVTIPSDYEAIG